MVVYVNCFLNRNNKWNIERAYNWWTQVVERRILCVLNTTVTGIVNSTLHQGYTQSNNSTIIQTQSVGKELNRAICYKVYITTTLRKGIGGRKLSGEEMNEEGHNYPYLSPKIMQGEPFALL